MMKNYRLRYFKNKFNYDSYGLAGDIGGTNTNLCIAGIRRNKPELLFSMHFKSAELRSLLPAVEEIIKYAKEKHCISVRNCCFGVAGPVSGDYARTVNLKWDVDAKALSRKTGLKIMLINDFQAIGYGINLISKKDLFAVRNGKGYGNKAVLGAGTGLGKSILFFDGKRYIPMPSEGGHEDFPCQNEFELKLAEFIRKKKKIKQINYEELVSGRGLEIIYEFLSKKKANAKEISKNRAKDRLCRESFKLFVKFYARCAKNFVLDSLATGGLYIAGGIAAKNKEIFKSKEFIKEFENVDRLSGVLAKVPVYVITNYDIGMIGASYFGISESFKNKT